MRFAPIMALLAACAPLEPQRAPPIPKVETIEVPVIVRVPCFEERDRPTAPVPTPIDLDNATVDQKAAALAADNANDERYMREIEALFVQCMKSQGKEIR